MQVHLKPLERAGLLDRWDDTRIQAGDRWRDEIKNALTDARAAVLLVSADFLASDFISSEEIPFLLAAGKERGLPIFLLMLKPCRLSGTPLADVQAFHPLDRPLIQMEEAEQEALWAKLADELERCLTAIPIKKETAPAASIWNVPYEENPFFIANETIRESLRKQLHSYGRAALTGLGGIGKTQVAVDYAHRERNQYNYVFWVRAETEADLVAGFVEIGRLLGLPESKESSHQTAVEATRGWLENQKTWLLIFDYADKLELLKDFRPRNRAGHLIVTSRNPSVHQYLGISTSLVVEKMTVQEAVDFLYKRTGRSAGDEREDSAAAELAQELGCLPLALEQAAAYITANQTRFYDYLRGYRTRRLAVLTAPVAGEYPDSVATTWALNFREVAQVPEAAELLRFSAFLSPDSIPLELIAKGAPELGPILSAALADIQNDPLLLDETLEPLYRYSLVRRDVSSRTYSIHPIVQAVLLDSMPQEEQRIWAERTVRAVKRAFPVPDSANWPACDRMLPNAQICATLIQKWKFEFPEAGFLLLDAGDYLRRRARFSEAALMHQQLLALREQVLGPNHSAIADTLASLGKVTRKLGRYEEAEKYLQRALSIAKQNYGEDHPQVSSLLNTLAAIHQDTGQLEKAESAARLSLEIRKNSGNLNDSEHAKILTNLASILKNRGQYEEAEELLNCSITIEQKLFGPDHPHLAASLTMLGEIYRLQNRLQDAEAPLQKALHLDETALRPDHPAVAYSILALAELYMEQERSDEAIALFQRALQIREKALGPEHPHVKETAGRYREVLQRLGRPPQ